MLFILILFSLLSLQLKGNTFIERNYIKVIFSHSQLRSTSSVQLSFNLFNFRFFNNFSYSYLGTFRNYQNVGDYVIHSSEEEIYNIREKILFGYENEKFFVFSSVDYSFYNFYQSFFTGGGIIIKLNNLDVGMYIDEIDFSIGGYKLNFMINTRYNEIENLNLLLSKDFQTKPSFKVESEIRIFKIDNFKINLLFSYATCFVNSSLLPYGIGSVIYMWDNYRIRFSINFSDILFSNEFALESFF